MTYSEIVDLVQGDTEKGAELLIRIAEAQKAALLKKEQAEIDAREARQTYAQTKEVVKNVCKHLNVKPHFYLTKDGKYYHFTPEFQAFIEDIDWEL